MSEKYIFNNSQDDFIKRNFLNFSISKLSESLGLSISLIRRRKKELNLIGKKQNKWSKKQIEFLKENSDKLSDTEISKLLGISRYAISMARYRNGISKNHSKIRKRMMIEGKIKHPTKDKKVSKESVGKRLMTIKLRYGKLSAWNKGKKGLQVAWNKGISPSKSTIEKMLKTKEKNNSIMRGEKHHFYGKTKENSVWAKRNSERMKNGGAFRALRGVKKPTSYELKISKICIENNLPFVYVGNGKFLIGKKNPDFVDKSNKKVIEVYSKFFKIRDYGSTEEYELQRSKHFKSYGYDTLFLDEDDMTSKEWENLCLNKILNFLNPIVPISINNKLLKNPPITRR